MKKTLQKWIVPALFWIVMWQMAALGVHQELLLPGPIQVMKRMSMVTDGKFFSTVGMTMLRTAAAYGIGIVCGCAIAVVCHLNEWIDALLRPMLSFVRATPVASFIILALVWLGSSDVPVLAGALMVIPVVFSGVNERLKEVDPKLKEMAKCFRFSRKKTWRHVIIPSVIPGLTSACETCIGLCFKATIAAEVIGVPKKAIGSNLYSAKIYLETDSLMAWTLLAVLLSMALEKALKALMKRGMKRGHFHM